MLSSFLRIVTPPRVFAVPRFLEGAGRFVRTNVEPQSCLQDSLLGRARCKVDFHWNCAVARQSPVPRPALPRIAPPPPSTEPTVWSPETYRPFT